ncbi:MAG: DegV family protein [Eubacteriales bacterium]|nr:DegV family protein [Eubacteriales bacterium]
MADYILSCESTVDILEEQLRSRNISYISYAYSINGKEYLDDFGKTIPYEDFYRMMSEGADTSTSQINIARYEDFWRTFLEAGKDVVHLSFSSGITGGMNSARNAAASLVEEFPERKIYIVDSLAASSGHGLLLDAAADKRDEGLSASELVQWLEENKLKLHHWFFSTDLSFYVKGGRISKTAAVFGGALHICPLLNMDYLGRLIPREKIRTKKRVIEETVKRMELHAQNGTDYSGKCYICHSNCYDDAKKVADLIEERFPKLNGKPEIFWVGTTVGAHTGPGTVSIFFWGDERAD